MTTVHAFLKGGHENISGNEAFDTVQYGPSTDSKVTLLSHNNNDNNKYK